MCIDINSSSNVRPRFLRDDNTSRAREHNSDHVAMCYSFVQLEHAQFVKHEIPAYVDQATDFWLH